MKKKMNWFVAAGIAGLCALLLVPWYAQSQPGIGFLGKVTGGNSGYVLRLITPTGSDNITADGNMTVSSMATSITVANEATDTTCFPVFTTAATGALGPKTNANLKFDSNTGTLDATVLKQGGVGVQPLDAFLSAIAAVSPTAGCIMLGGATDTFSCLPSGTTGQLLRAVTGGSPAYTTATFPAIAAAGDILYSSATNVWDSLAKGSAGQQLRMNAGATAPEWTGVTVTSHAATEAATAATMYGNTHLVTGAYTVTLPTAVAGYSATFCSTTAAVFSVDLQATDYWILNGTTLTLANKVSSSGFAGECISFVATATNYYRSTMINGTFIDGGA